MPTPGLNWATDPVDKLRHGYNTGRQAILHESAPGVEIEDHGFATGPGLVFVPATLRSQTDILFLHGGGWIVGSPWTHRTLCSWLAHLTGRRVFAAPYRLAPEAKFPTQAQDAATLVDEFAQTRDGFVLAGDSAGGAMIVWGESGAHHRGQVRALISLYGAFGVHDSRSLSKYGATDDDLGPAALMAMYRHLGCEDPTDFQNHFARDGAPILLVRAECDPVADDNDWFAAHTDRSVTHLMAPGQAHAFLQFCGSNPAARDCMAQVAQWLDGVVE